MVAYLFFNSGALIKLNKLNALGLVVSIRNRIKLLINENLIKFLLETD